MRAVPAECTLGAGPWRYHLHTADPYEIALPLAWPQRLAAVAGLIGVLAVHALLFAVAVSPAELRAELGARAGWTCAALLLGASLLNTSVLLRPPSLRVSVSGHGVRLGRSWFGVEELLGCRALPDRLELSLAGRRT